MVLRPEHARPWREAIVQMTGLGSVLHPEDWRAHLRPIAPRLHRPQPHGWAIYSGAETSTMGVLR